MKTSILILFIVLSSFSLKAQYPKGQYPEERATTRAKSLTSMLNLTDQQTEKVKQICWDHYISKDSLTRIIVKRGPNPKTIDSALTPVYLAKELELNKKVSSVLNNDQKLVYAKYLSTQKYGGVISIARPVPPR